MKPRRLFESKNSWFQFREFLFTSVLCRIVGRGMNANICRRFAFVEWSRQREPKIKTEMKQFLLWIFCFVLVFGFVLFSRTRARRKYKYIIFFHLVGNVTTQKTHTVLCTRTNEKIIGSGSEAHTFFGALLLLLLLLSCVVLVLCHHYYFFFFDDFLLLSSCVSCVSRCRCRGRVVSLL